VQQGLRWIGKDSLLWYGLDPVNQSFKNLAWHLFSMQGKLRAVLGSAWGLVFSPVRCVSEIPWKSIFEGRNGKPPRGR